jgi:hypothetical protein
VTLNVEVTQQEAEVNQMQHKDNLTQPAGQPSEI